MEDLNQLEKREKALAKAAEGLKEVQNEMTEIKQKKFDIQYQETLNQQENVREAEKECNKAKKEGGEILITLSVKTNSTKRRKVTLELDNDAVGGNPNLTSGRDLVVTNLIASAMAAITQEQQKLRGEHPQELMVFNENKRKAQKAAAEANA